MSQKTAQTGRQAKKRIDLNSPEYPAVPYICLTVLIVQAILAGTRHEDWSFGFSLIMGGLAFVAEMLHAFTDVRPRTPDLIPATQSNSLPPPALIAITALLGMLGICLKDASESLSLPSGAVLWGWTGLVGAFLVFQLFLDRRKARLKAEGRRPPKFWDREREDRIHFVELLARIAVEFAKADSPFTEAKRAVILALFTDQLGYEGARLGSIRLFIKEEVDMFGEGGFAWSRSIMDRRLRELLRNFRRTCSYDSHLMLLGLLFRVAQASGVDREKALDLAREIGLALDLEPKVVQEIETQSQMSEAEQAREEAERQERTERARREQERAERRREREKVREQAKRRHEQERAERRREWEQEQAERRRRTEESRRQGREQEDEARRRHSQQARRPRPATKEEQAFAILGLDPGTPFTTVKKTYRRLIVQYHPDKVAHLGEEYRRIATEKSKVINAAYSYLEALYGR